MGNLLDHDTDMTLDMFYRILERCAADPDIRRVNLLGGEPTLHPLLPWVVAWCAEHDLSVSIVSNGGPALLSILPQIPNVHISLSLESAVPSVNDKIRGRGSTRDAFLALDYLKTNTTSFSGVISVSRMNVDSAIDTIGVLLQAGATHVNVHYVTDRGFAKTSQVLSPEEWGNFLTTLASSFPAEAPIRIERTFVPHGTPVNCRLQDGSNLMYFPDGRVFTCSMLVDIPLGHAYRDTPAGLQTNAELPFEANCSSCPAMGHVNPGLVQGAKASDQVIDCIFSKMWIHELAETMSPTRVGKS